MNPSNSKMVSNHDNISKEVSSLKMPPQGTLTMTAEERKIVVNWCTAQESTEGTSWWKRLF
ncbi:hypothetical protein COW36_04365 [bacterium (Candidatus Blackallbacteria) CG17_big_fil_post_rev_8_21_14_2_50_48_46]|uniref:Uncharacterized protein n=1 Tax=bacterium (Candidatus Blackallbacteria) CG17_big_fil_post_rev_8_21_14_2_50_48_46 TaxID=2014261 RepID=A0A2M7G8W1_9BACT|nr:MAG: hypothetical protein COW64_04580 [bacterium (Candidatus Blackallbacteria) CG18_big_fil_WC_8_21_14_2_50_49_26]PIW18533.1 MAG: hypothetical protein COW36_04365 [bacterium (Candidatus Blackallbacteria) CG17_big_fil_post_rev_8_21_14_2_50_48_46]PIW46482.1 MAG: hypothetical protein COW20_16315 [bacterium (Candidatus Blackallbacteria) CG13_big_fil_rev_8_21_14_2_50_49_14]